MKRRTSFAGARCLITGAASGIGRATALAAARRGALLVLTDRDADGLASVAAQVRASGGRVLRTAAFDITDREAIQAFAAEVHAEHGSMDVVMNVAGHSIWGPVDRLRDEHWRAMVEVDLMGPIAIIEAFVPPMMRARRGGHLVNVSSAAGLLGLPWHAAYSAAKFGLRGVSEVLRFDLERHRIGVTLVCPGAVATPLTQTVEIVGVDREHPAAQKLHGDFTRHARTPEQVAEAILRGCERGTYLVFTSPDIRAAHLVQRWCPPLYAQIMRLLNRRLTKVGRAASVPQVPA